MNVLFIGDIVGSTGRKSLKTVLPYVKEKYRPDVIIANGENAAGGRGINSKIANDLFEWGIHGITMGNHTWDNKDIFNFIENEKRLVRPANYPEGTPGRGLCGHPGQRERTGCCQHDGQDFLPPLECPFKKADELLEELSAKTRCILFDFHAEATSEKIAMGWHLDGKASAVLGTHTHVQTHDHAILPGGTAYITDVGMVGSKEGILGMDRDAVLRKFKTQLPVRFNAADGKWHFHAVAIQIDEKSGKAKDIRLIRLDEDLMMFN